MTQGEALVKSGDSDGAIAAFSRALTMEPHDGLALQRLAEAYTTKGQTDQALATYRTLLYHVPGQRWSNSNENSPTVLSHFALLLLQKGQTSEALASYQRAAFLLNHEDGKEHNLDADLPEFGGGPGQTSYTPRMLEAMAHLALGIDTFGHEGYGVPEPLANFQQALSLAPDSAAANLYLGKYLFGKSDPGAKAYLEKAVRLGDDHTAASAKGVLQFIR